MKDISVDFIKKMDIDPYKKEFRDIGFLSDETLEKIMGRKPILASNYMDCDSMIMAGDEIHLWRTCQNALYERLTKEAS